MSEILENFDDNTDIVTIDDTLEDNVRESVTISSGTEVGELRFRLSDFEGPFDLLLELVKRAEIEIKDLFISDITDQYLAMMEDIGSIDVDKAVEFLDVASRLLYIKSESVLPVDPQFEELDVESAKDLLLRQFEEYRIIKEATDRLQPNEIINRFYREPDFDEKDAKVVIKDFNFEKLMDAFTQMLMRVHQPEAVIEHKEIVRDRYTVADRINYIAKTLRMRKKMRFSELFDNDSTKSETINTFLALLQLLKHQYLSVEQAGLYEEIDITYNDGIEIQEDLSFLDESEEINDEQSE
ncbi:MAG: segregation/condensation protein A [Clostridia bacterium]|nr:segregation/condensation protein A [Clostridia bacterium]